MDAKISCLVKGLIGIIFGGLAITVPDPTLAIFSALFGVIIVAGLIICIFLAITSHSEGSLFWFLASTVLLIIGIVSFIIPDLVTILFVIVIFYSAVFWVKWNGQTPGKKIMNIKVVKTKSSGM